MSKLRKIYKGEENWECIFNEQDEILKGPTAKGKVDENKEFSEDHPERMVVEKTKNHVNRIAHKLDNVNISNAAIDNDNIYTEDDLLRAQFEVNEEDFEHFYQNYDMEGVEEDGRGLLGNNKRTHNEAFGNEESEGVEEKRAKFG
jgi:hypothetical protein